MAYLYFQKYISSGPASGYLTATSYFNEVVRANGSLYIFYLHDDEVHIDDIQFTATADVFFHERLGQELKGEYKKFTKIGAFIKIFYIISPIFLLFFQI